MVKEITAEKMKELDKLGINKLLYIYACDKNITNMIDKEKQSVREKEKIIEELEKINKFIEESEVSDARLKLSKK